MILTMLYGGIVGIALGLTGGGGSIFAVPLLLYAIGLLWNSAVGRHQRITLPYFQPIGWKCR